jgi:peptidoglycan-N-acetylmuramic acid deacetylase
MGDNMKLIRNFFALTLIIIYVFALIDLTNKEDMPVAINDFNNKIFYYGDSQDNFIYLTFDDGFGRNNTKQILDILEAENVKATFFFEGNFLKTNPDLILRAYKFGHVFGNHTYSHKNAANYTNEKFIEELEKVEKLFYQITKSPLDKLYRPPMGFISHSNLEVLKEKGYKVMMWSVSYEDWDYKKEIEPAYTFQEIVSNTKNGSIILMHTMNKANVEALSDIIKELKKRGYEFATLDLLYRL